MIEARQHGAMLVRLLAPTGQRNQCLGLPLCLTTDTFGKLVAIQIRHANIQDANFRSKLFCYFEGFAARVGYMHQPGNVLLKRCAIHDAHAPIDTPQKGLTSIAAEVTPDLST